MGVYFTISAILYVIIFIVNLFSKKTIQNVETKIYKVLILSTFIGLCLEVLSFALYATGIDTDSFLYILSAKAVFVYFITWIAYFTYYIYAISFNNKYDELEYNYRIQKIGTIFNVVIVFLSVVAMFLPIQFNVKDDVVFPIGLSVDLVYGTVAVFIVLCFVFAFKNVKNIISKKYTPLFAMVILLIAATVVQKIFPQLFLVNFALSVIVVILYFSIENPDIKMIKELTYSREMLERANNATNKCLSTLTKDIYKPLEKLNEFGHKEINSDNRYASIKELKKLQDSSIKLVDEINGVIELSKLESSNYELNNNDYATEELFDELRNLLKTKSDDSKINIVFNFDKKINKVLNGDVAKIKQTIIYLYDYLIERCRFNNVEFKVSTVNAKLSTRLRFSFIITKDIDKDAIFNSDTIEMEIINRLVELQNAKLETLKENGKVIISALIMQKIIDKYEIETHKVKEKTVEYFDCTNKHVLIVDDNMEKVNQLVKKLKPYNCHIDMAYNYLEYEEKIFGKTKWDLILLDDMMPDTDKFEFFNLSDDKKAEAIKRIEKLTNEVVPLVVMLTPNKELNDKLNYDSLLKPINDNDLFKVMKKYMFKK